MCGHIHNPPKNILKGESNESIHQGEQSDRAGIHRGSVLRDVLGGLIMISRSIRDGMHDLPLRSEKTNNTTLLVSPKPGLAGFTQDFLGKEVDELTDNDQNKGNGVHPMDVIMEDLDANDHTPEVHGEHGDVEESRRGKTEQQRSKTVEQTQTQRVTGEIPADLSVPVCIVEGGPVEDTSLRAVDYHSEE